MDDKIRYYLEKLKPHLIKEKISLVARLERVVGEEFESLEVVLGNDKASQLQMTLPHLLSDDGIQKFIENIKKEKEQ